MYSLKSIYHSVILLAFHDKEINIVKKRNSKF